MCLTVGNHRAAREEAALGRCGGLRLTGSSSFEDLGRADHEDHDNNKQKEKNNIHIFLYMGPLMTHVRLYLSIVCLRLIV